MSNQLIDPFGRSVEYIRLSVTDRCDLRCFYCLPGDYRDFQEPEEWLTFDEIERVIRAFASLGIQRLRVTGGEPLVRKNLPALVTQLSGISGIEDLSLSTNAVSLARQAEDLKTAGISRIRSGVTTGAFSSTSVTSSVTLSAADQFPAASRASIP